MTRAGVRRMALLVAGGLAAAGTAWLLSGRVVRGRLPSGDYDARPAAEWEVPGADAAAMREDALRCAQVWREPAVPLEQADLASPAPEARPLDTSALVCKFLPRPHSGTTPKFDCIRRGGEVIKVKYARTGEIEAELAATRLLTALGFGADRMYLVPRLRCHGCPRNPFRTYQVLELVRFDAAYTRWIDYDAYVDFEWISAERRLEAPTINGPEAKGWAFHELDKIDPARGGGSRAQVDALRLIAAFLHHWDNKAENQRRQIRDLFAGARFAEFHAPGDPGADLGNWVRAFEHKVREIADRPPCPDLTSAAGPSPSPRWRPSA